MIRTLCSACLIASTASGNPLFNGADPHVVVVGKEYWAYPTEHGTQKPIFAAYRSPDLKAWKREGELLNLDDIPWVKDGGPKNRPWAPSVVEKNKRFYFYYSIGPQTDVYPSRIGVATGDSPAGPFKDSGKPLLTGGNGFEAIDPMVFIDPTSGKSFFYAGGSAGSTLRVFELEDDMIRFKREIKTTTPPHFTEGPFMHRRGGTYYLSYSHGRFNGPDYSVHYATAESPEGPWKYQARILESDGSRKGPGHHAFVENPSTGEWFIVYHRWETTEQSGPYRGSRKIAVEKVSYDAQGLIGPIRMTDEKSPSSPIKD